MQSPVTEWLIRHQHSQSWLAKQLGCTPAFISMLCRGQKNPGPHNSLEIERISGGEVRSRDLFLYHRFVKGRDGMQHTRQSPSVNTKLPQSGESPLKGEEDRA